MFDYDAEYRRLRQAGLPGWGAMLEAGRMSRLPDALDRLHRTKVFPPAPARILELGCGNGLTLLAMAERGHQVFGIDISETAIDWARENFANAGHKGMFRVGNVCAMPFFEQGSFDVVIDGQCLHCLIGNDRGACLSEARRVLRPDGVFFISSMVAPPKSEEARLRHDAGRGWLLREGKPYRTLKSLEDLAQELTEAGFEIGEHTLGVNPWWDHVMMISRASYGTLERAR